MRHCDILRRMTNVIPFEQALQEPVRARTTLILDVLAVAGLMAAGALVRIPLPFSPVPMTLQTFVVLLAAFAVGRHRAAAGILVYIALGTAGAPLFAVQSGATFGYLAAFAAAPYVVTAFRRPASGMIAATLLVYGLGAAWLVLALGLSPMQAILAGVVPFVSGDAIKLIAAHRLVGWLRA